MAYLMDVRPAKGTQHVLGNRKRETIFEWTGTAWSTPGTGWGTRPSAMAALGWRYLRPADSRATPAPTEDA